MTFFPSKRNRAIAARSIFGAVPLYFPSFLALTIPSSWRSRRRLVSNSANTPSDRARAQSRPGLKNEHSEIDRQRHPKDTTVAGICLVPDMSMTAAGAHAFPQAANPIESADYTPNTCLGRHCERGQNMTGRRASVSDRCFVSRVNRRILRSPAALAA